MTISPQTLNIAIVGAGIAGIIAAIAFRQLPHVRVEIYGRATGLKEIRASIALEPNSLRTLQRLGLDNTISDEKTNEIISNDEHEGVAEYLHQPARYHRAHLHQALVEAVPTEIIQLRKKLVSAVVDENGVDLEFEDRSTVTAD